MVFCIRVTRSRSAVFCRIDLAPLHHPVDRLQDQLASGRGATGPRRFLPHGLMYFHALFGKPKNQSALPKEDAGSDVVRRGDADRPDKRAMPPSPDY
jgi:hypothetical protein